MSCPSVWPMPRTRRHNRPHAACASPHPPVTLPNPALVTQRDVQRLPRLALWLFCAAYLLPGLFGRDPWKHADITAFGHMLGIARGWAPLLEPSIGGVAAQDGGLLPYWLGAAFIRLLPWLDPAFAARVPFALLLGGVLALTWYSCYYLARTDAAQPLPLAFGGEARPVDYARALADGALLALIASLGLLQLGHETTPELLQLAGTTLCLFALAAAAAGKPVAPRVAILLALPVMAGSGAATLALLLAALSAAASILPQAPGGLKRLRPWVALSAVLALAAATAMETWSWRLGWPSSGSSLIRLLVWFTWPAWLLAGWTLWRWRGRLQAPHIALPLMVTLLCLAGSLAMGGSDRGLLLGLPALAVLAAFALPTLKRAVSSAIDWFSVFFFTALVLAMWVIYGAMHTGFPAQTAANVYKLASPGFRPPFSAWALAWAAAGTLAWLALVRWRTARHQHALWKSLVLPASGVALCWLLAMTLWLPLLDEARSYRSLIERTARHIPPAVRCVAAPGASTSLLAALEYFGHYRVHGLPDADRASGCRYLVVSLPSREVAPVRPGWRFIARERERTINTESLLVYRRAR